MATDDETVAFLPAEAGQEAVVVSVVTKADGIERARPSQAFDERCPIVGWRVVKTSRSGRPAFEAEPILPISKAPDAVVFLVRPDGLLALSGGGVLADVNAARESCLNKRQSAWDRRSGVGDRRTSADYPSEPLSKAA